uniref:Uncharacterized protein n=2 Tax=Aegilops tauschii subsp. strangulata TaxID=200361 RepID=A0A452Y1K8_AEGTS
GGGMNGQGRWAMRATPSTRSAPPLTKSSPRAPHPIPSSLVSSHGQLPILLRFPSPSSFPPLRHAVCLHPTSSLPPQPLQESRPPCRPGSAGGRGDPGVQAVARSMRGDGEPICVGGQDYGRSFGGCAHVSDCI